MADKNKGTINRERIGGKKPVIPANSADSLFIDPASVTFANTDTPKISTRPVIINPEFVDPSEVAVVASNPPIKNESAKDLFEKIDVPDLSDIEIINPIEKYFDTVTKEEKAKATIRVRNSSIKPEDVIGIDVRIINNEGVA